MNDKDFLQWIHDRLENQHGENHNYDYMHKLRAIIATIPESQRTPNITTPAQASGEKLAKAMWGIDLIPMRPVSCAHEAYQGQCAHCGVPIVNGFPKYPAVQPAAGREEIVNRDDGPLLDHHRLGVDREDLASISTPAQASETEKSGEPPRKTPPGQI